MAAPFDIVQRALRGAKRVICVGSVERDSASAYVRATVDAVDFAAARGIVDTTLARGLASVWRAFAYTERPSSDPPAAL